MSAIIINSPESLQAAIGNLREMWRQFGFLRLNVKTGQDRSLPQNSITHAWYGQIARELREDDALGWKCYCKLHHGVPILRAEDDEFREAYDTVIKPLSYEKKLIAMRCWPVTSLMTKDQLSRYGTQCRPILLGVACGWNTRKRRSMRRHAHDVPQGKPSEVGGVQKAGGHAALRLLRNRRPVAGRAPAAHR